MKELMKSDVFSREFLSNISQIVSPSCLSLPKQIKTATLTFWRTSFLRRCDPQTLLLPSFHTQSCFGEQYTGSSPLPPPPQLSTPILPSHLTSWYTTKYQTLRLAAVVAAFWKGLSPYTPVGAFHIVQVSAPMSPSQKGLSDGASQVTSLGISCLILLFPWLTNIHHDLKLIYLFFSFFIFGPPHFPPGYKFCENSAVTCPLLCSGSLTISTQCVFSRPEIEVDPVVVMSGRKISFS